MSIGACVGKHIGYEIGQSARQFLATNSPDMLLRGTVVDRPDSDLVHTDVFTSGFPCQPFSHLGLQQGWNDARGRGTLVLESLRYLEKAMPTVAVLENVRAFASTDGGGLLHWLLGVIQEVGYATHVLHACTSQHGLPLTRKRVYIVCALFSALVCPFYDPEVLDPIPLIAVLEPPPARHDLASRLPPISQRLARENVLREHHRLHKSGIPLHEAFPIIDCDASKDWCGKGSPFAPCLTRSRRQGYWSIAHGARLSIASCDRLQGISYGSVSWPTNNGDAISLLGNAMSKNVLDRVLHMAFTCIGLAAEIGDDRWATGIAQH